jgi:hypothetical protein
MKSKFSILAMVLVLNMVVFSCKEKPPPPKTDQEINKEILMSTAWVPAAGSNQITVGTPPSDVSDSWRDFELTFGDGSYSSTGAPNPEIWPASGTWAFDGTSATTLIRDGALEITLSTISDTALKMEFTYTAGRVNGIEGAWVFNMVPK